MSSNSSPSPPPAPDPTATAAAQTASNVDTAVANAKLNRIDTTSPWGSQTYNAQYNPQYDTSAYNAALQNWQDMGQIGTKPSLNDYVVPGSNIPTYSVTDSLSPTQQALYDQSTQQAIAKNNLANQYIGGAFTNMANNPYVNTSNLPPIQSGVTPGHLDYGIAPGGPIQTQVAAAGPIQTQVAPAGRIQSSLDLSNLPTIPGLDDFNGARDQTISSIYGQASPMMDIQQKNLENQLVNEGVQQGSEAWDNALVPLDNERNNLMMQAVQGGNQEQQQLFGLGLSANNQVFGQDLASGQFNNQAQSQQFGENAQTMQLDNAAQAQRFGQNATSMELGNAAQNQQFGENAQQASFNNQTQGQAFGQGLQDAQLADAAQQQGFNQDVQRFELPINEYNALASGTQMQAPGYAATAPVAMQGTPVGQYAYQSYQGQQDAYNQQVASDNSTQNGLFGLGGSALMAGAMFL